MRFTGVRRAVATSVLALLPALGGCSALGLGAEEPTGARASAGAGVGAEGESWVEVEPGRPTPSPAVVRRAAPASAAPSTAPPAAAPECADRPVGQVVIPVAVASGAGRFTVTWPRYGSSSAYRIAAVPQELLNGEQPPVDWKPVAGGSGCTVTGTITGLSPGEPYVVWLDAPGTGHRRDGSRNPYSGASRVVYPR